MVQIFIVFFLWDTIFTNPNTVLFGYDRAKILTYVFGILVVKAFVFSARSVDVAGEIADGNLSNYLSKPVNYFTYWLTRDIASKALNLCFAVFEIVILYLLLKPEIYFQTNAFYLLATIVALILAMSLFFVIRFITSFITFWAPELGWGAQFLVVIIIVEFLSGALFPLDILPIGFQKFLYLTPFAYLLFFPLQVYLGQISSTDVIGGVVVSAVWLIVLIFTMKWIWNKGLKSYGAYGR